jgi:hypothetical protein
MQKICACIPCVRLCDWGGRPRWIPLDGSPGSRGDHFRYSLVMKSRQRHGQSYLKLLLVLSCRRPAKSLQTPATYGMSWFVKNFNVAPAFGLFSSIYITVDVLTINSTCLFCLCRYQAARAQRQLPKDGLPLGSFPAGPDPEAFAASQSCSIL